MTRINNHPHKIKIKIYIEKKKEQNKNGNENIKQKRTKERTKNQENKMHKKQCNQIIYAFFSLTLDLFGTRANQYRKIPATILNPT